MVPLNLASLYANLSVTKKLNCFKEAIYNLLEIILGKSQSP